MLTGKRLPQSVNLTSVKEKYLYPCPGRTGRAGVRGGGGWGGWGGGGGVVEGG